MKVMNKIDTLQMRFGIIPEEWHTKEGFSQAFVRLANSYHEQISKADPYLRSILGNNNPDIINNDHFGEVELSKEAEKYWYRYMNVIPGEDSKTTRKRKKLRRDQIKQYDDVADLQMEILSKWTRRYEKRGWVLETWGQYASHCRDLSVYLDVQQQQQQTNNNNCGTNNENTICTTTTMIISYLNILRDIWGPIIFYRPGKNPNVILSFCILNPYRTMFQRITPVLTRARLCFRDTSQYTVKLVSDFVTLLLTRGMLLENILNVHPTKFHQSSIGAFKSLLQKTTKFGCFTPEELRPYWKSYLRKRAQMDESIKTTKKDQYFLSKFQYLINNNNNDSDGPISTMTDDESHCRDTLKSWVNVSRNSTVFELLHTLQNQQTGKKKALPEDEILRVVSGGITTSPNADHVLKTAFPGINLSTNLMPQQQPLVPSRELEREAAENNIGGTSTRSQESLYEDQKRVFNTSRRRNLQCVSGRTL